MSSFWYPISICSSFRSLYSPFIFIKKLTFGFWEGYLESTIPIKSFLLLTLLSVSVNCFILVPYFRTCLVDLTSEKVLPFELYNFSFSFLFAVYSPSQYIYSLEYYPVYILYHEITEPKLLNLFLIFLLFLTYYYCNLLLL